MASARQDFIRAKFGADVKSVLQRLYVDEQLGCTTIGRMFGCAANHVAYMLKAHGFAIRSRRERAALMTGERNPMFFACKTPEFRRKLSAAQKRRFANGARPWNTGLTLPNYNHMAGRLDKEKNPKWNGGRRTHCEGYISIRRPDHPSAVAGYVYEHRLIMERRLGRYLRSDEHVHHVNGDPTDNRSENLQLLSRRAHARAHGETRTRRAKNSVETRT